MRNFRFWSLNASCAESVPIFGEQCHCYPGNCEAEEVNGLICLTVGAKVGWWCMMVFTWPFLIGQNLLHTQPPITAITSSTYQPTSPFCLTLISKMMTVKSPEVLVLLPANKNNW
jgi:hypothetical protein